jgi:hypothetical protein
MSSRTSTNTFKLGDLAVVAGTTGGPVMLVTGFGYLDQGTCRGPSAKLESLRRHDEDTTMPAWTAEFLIDGLRVLPEGHPAKVSPYYDFSVGGRHKPE